MKTDYLYKIKICENISADLVRLQLNPLNNKMKFLAGQFCKIKWSDGVQRSFSIANAPNRNGIIEIIIRKRGIICSLLDDFKEGDFLQLEGPCGINYFKTNYEKSIILIAFGVGVVPHKAILEEIIRNKNYSFPVTLHWKIKSKEDLAVLADKHHWLSHSRFKFNITHDLLDDESFFQSIRMQHNDFNQSLIYISGSHINVKTVMNELKKENLCMENVRSDM